MTVRNERGRASEPAGRASGLFVRGPSHLGGPLNHQRGLEMGDGERKKETNKKNGMIWYVVVR